MSEATITPTQQSQSSKPILAALAALVVITAVLSLGGSPSATAQEAAPLAVSALPGTSIEALSEGVDWSRVRAVPASPEQSVAAYER